MSLNDRKCSCARSLSCSYDLSKVDANAAPGVVMYRIKAKERLVMKHLLGLLPSASRRRLLRRLSLFEIDQEPGIDKTVTALCRKTFPG
jgi:hypothetical protein